jgi:hypothetical protein
MQKMQKESPSFIKVEVQDVIIVSHDGMNTSFP